MFNKINVFEKAEENNNSITKLLTERYGEWFVYTEYHDREILSQAVFHTALIKHIEDKTVYMFDRSIFILSQKGIEELISVLKKHEATNQQIIKNKADRVEIETKTKR